MAVQTQYRYVSSSPDVRSGHAIISGTRIGVHDIVGLILNGATVDDATRSFPSLTRAQVYEALCYYEDNKEEIDLLVARQMASEPC